MRLTRYNYRLYPTKTQEVLLAKTFGCARWVYNWALEMKTRHYQETQEGLSIFEIDTRLTQLKKQEETAWLKEVNAQALQGALRNLDKAYTAFFRKQNGFPRFKSRHDRQSFVNPQQTAIDWDNSTLIVPKFREGVKAVLHRRFDGEIKSSTVTRTKTGCYYVSVVVEEDVVNPQAAAPTEERTLGIDVGLKSFYTDSAGNEVANPHHLERQLKRLCRAQRKLSRRQKDGKNRDKARHRVAVLHEQVANSRKDFLHKLTTTLVKNQDYDSFAVEDLAIDEMRQKSPKHRSRAIGDVGWGMFRQFLTYKCERAGKNLLVIGRFEPSSKLCTCGQLNHELTLKDREWTCSACHTHHKRDHLAAQNIRRFAFCRQNTSKDSVARESRESTPTESCVSGSTKWEGQAIDSRR